MLKPGLRGQIISVLILVMAIASFLIAVVVFNITKKAILNQQRETSITLINAFQHSLETLLSENPDLYFSPKNNWKIQRLVKLWSLENRVENILLIDLKGKIIAASNPDLIGNIFLDSALNPISKLPPYRELSSSPTFPLSKPENKTTLSFFSPLYINNQKSGAIKLSLSLNGIQPSLRHAYQLIFGYIILTSLLLTFFAILLFSRLIVQPINKLVKATEALSEGYYSITPDSGGETRNEIGQLSFAFNRMAEKIEENQNQLQAQIDYLKLLNQQLQQSQQELLAKEKLALVGKLAAGVAHEIGNPLSIILGYISLLQKSKSQDPESTDYLNRIEQELNRINATIRELLDFSRISPPETTTVNLITIIEKTLSLIQHQRKFSTLTLITHFLAHPLLIEGNENQLQQLFLNLLLNASEAVNENGKIVIFADRMHWQYSRLVSTEKDPPPTIFASVPDFGWGKEEIILDGINFPENQPLARVIVADDGEGIEPENLDRIFDPFFTTREPGKGTGLGLAICKRIVESLRGNIRVQSKVKEGTAFLLLFPLKEVAYE